MCCGQRLLHGSGSTRTSVVSQVPRTDVGRAGQQHHHHHKQHWHQHWHQHQRQHPWKLLQANQVQQPQSACAVAVRTAALAAMAVASLVSSSPVQAATADANFGTKCVGCHVNGGNIIVAGATLFQEDLVKNGLDDAESLYKLIYSGKGRMPGFGADCAPKLQCTFGPRLSDEEVQDLVAYVQQQAAAGWKQ